MDDLGVTYLLSGLSDDFIGGNRESLVSASTVFSAWPATKKKGRGGGRNEIVVSPGALISLEARQRGGFGSGGGSRNGGGNRNGIGNGRMLRGGSSRRNLYQLQGTSTVLVVYVNSSDSSPTYDFNTVVNDVLGTDGDTANMVSR
jgi:hypothetical protein